MKIAVTAMQQGAVTLLQKPYNQDDLLKSVQRGVTLNIEHRQRQEMADAAKQRLSLLNAKEKEVLEQMLQGKSNKAVAQALGIGLRTVERRRHDIFSKTSVDSEVKLAELVQLAEYNDASHMSCTMALRSRSPKPLSEAALRSRSPKPLSEAVAQCHLLGGPSYGTQRHTSVGCHVGPLKRDTEVSAASGGSPPRPSMRLRPPRRLLHR